MRIRHLARILRFIQKRLVEAENCFERKQRIVCILRKP